MMDDRLDDALRHAAREYHRPPATPHEEMWRAIAAARATRRRPWLPWSLAAAAVLALGIALGRWTLRGREDADLIAPGAREPAAVAYQVAATQYLSRAEALLTGFRAESRVGGAVDAEFLRSARTLLTTTRLLLDSPAGRDPELATLLEDLELVLVQIVQLPGPRRAEEVDLIRQGLEQRGVLTRLRTAIPAGPGATQGAL